MCLSNGHRIERPADEYRFSATQNNGQITQRKDWVSGEEISYQYDSLNRLISAATTGPQWGQSFTYDGFGNLLAQTVTKGSAPTLSLNVNPATNRITTGGYGYDGNGNLTAMPMLTMTYDVENRPTQATDSSNGTETYNYDTGNQRVWKRQESSGLADKYFYGIDGNLLGTYGGDNTDYNVYFAGKQIWAEASQWLPARPVVEDRLGSTVTHFPYGEEASTTGQDRVKFATYYRDSTTALDYAQNRYYARTIGRFTTVDPYGGSMSLASPQSFNRYTYVGNDPVNSNDPNGLDPIVYPTGFGVSLVDRDYDPWSVFYSYWVHTQYYYALVMSAVGGGWPSGGGGGVSVTPVDTLIHVTGLAKSGKNYNAVLERLNKIALTVDQDCLSFLQSGGGNLQSYVSDLLQNHMLAVGDFAPGKAALTGVGGTDLPNGAAAIVVNNKDAFFKSSYRVDQSKITGGTGQAQTFLLLHELAHLLVATGFFPDGNDSIVGNANDKLIETNCSKTLGPIIPIIPSGPISGYSIK